LISVDVHKKGNISLT